MARSTTRRGVAIALVTWARDARQAALPGRRALFWLLSGLDNDQPAESPRTQGRTLTVMSTTGSHSSDVSAVRLTTGLPETVLPVEPQALLEALGEALAQPVERRRHAVSDVVRSEPRSLNAWAALGSLARDDVEAYACFRVGYHRGLDALRGAGWKGSGLVRWSHEQNRGFLRCLDGLRSASGAIGEQAEEERCAQFLRQLDPAWSPDWTGYPA